jgi:hypothetical protein
MKATDARNDHSKIDQICSGRFNLGKSAKAGELQEVNSTDVIESIGTLVLK